MGSRGRSHCTASGQTREAAIFSQGRRDRDSLSWVCARTAAQRNSCCPLDVCASGCLHLASPLHCSIGETGRRAQHRYRMTRNRGRETNEHHTNTQASAEEQGAAQRERAASRSPRERRFHFLNLATTCSAVHHTYDDLSFSCLGRIGYAGYVATERRNRIVSNWAGLAAALLVAQCCVLVLLPLRVSLFPPSSPRCREDLGSGGAGVCGGRCSMRRARRADECGVTTPR